MMDTFTCDDKDTLVAYLYGEVDVPTRRRVDEHLRACAACAAEVVALRGVREELVAWAPPEADLGFTIVRAPGGVLRPARWWTAASLPAWARAAAAVLIVATGIAIANLHVRYDASGLVVTTGWMTPAAGPASIRPPGDAAAPAAVASDEWRPALVALEADLRREIRRARDLTAGTVSGVRASSDAEVSLRRIQSMIEQSEQRQRQELALRLTQFNRDLEVQRRADLVRTGQVFGMFEGRTGAEIARQRQMLERMIVRVSAQQPQ